MLSNQPILAIAFSIVYVVIIFILVRKERNGIKYSLTGLSAFPQITFLFFWFRQIDILATGSNIGFEAFNTFFSFVNTSYFVLAIPFLLILAWYGVKKILVQDQSIWLKRTFSVVYVAALFSVLILGLPVFVILYYGLAP